MGAIILEGIKVAKRFTDEASGKDMHRPQLQLLLEYVRDGDTVVCHAMDRLARNLDDLRKIVLGALGLAGVAPAAFYSRLQVLNSYLRAVRNPEAPIKQSAPIGSINSLEPINTV